MSVLSKIALLNQIAALSGVGAWDLLEAKYNGCSFMTLSQPVNSMNPTTGLATGLASLADGDTYLQSIIGVPGGSSPYPDPNSSLYATSMSLMGVNDNLKRKFVRFRNPGGTDVIQDFGWQGSQIKMTAIFSGQDYLIGLNNFLNAVQANSSNLTTPATVGKYLVLEHPIYGTQKDVYLVDIQLTYSSQANSAVAIALTFECTNSISISNSRITTVSAFSESAKAFQQVEQSIFSLSQTIALGTSGISNIGGLI